MPPYTTSTFVSSFYSTCSLSILCFLVYIAFEAQNFTIIKAPSLSPQTTEVANFSLARPYRLIIPAIGVSTTIQTVGLAPDGSLGIPTNFTEVAWYKDSPLPGAPGNALIDGHLSGKKIPQAVFYDLAALQPGDKIFVYDEYNTKLLFSVTKTTTYEQNDTTHDLFATSSSAGLILITCAGSWQSDVQKFSERTVIFSTLVARTERN